MLVRRAYSPTALDTESEPLKSPLETKEPQPLSPTSADPSPDYTLATPHNDDESEPLETSKTKATSPHSTTPLADSTSPSSQRPPLTQTSPTPAPPRALYYHSITRMDEGIDSKSEEAASEDQQHEADSTEDTVKDEPLGLAYRVVRRCALERVMDIVPSTYEVGQSSRSTLDPQIAVETPPSLVGTQASPEWFLESPLVSAVVPSPVATSALVVALDEDDLLEIGAQLELYRSILHTYTEHLDSLPPSLFEG
nr:hypothetical protein [Tanacetum cinerariifolium]